DVGTVVHVYSDGEAFEVEFAAPDGGTTAVATLAAAVLRPITSRESRRPVVAASVVGRRAVPSESHEPDAALRTRRRLAMHRRKPSAVASVLPSPWVGAPPES